LFVNFLESRLDCALVRLHFAPNFKVARQWIKNGGVCVNNKILKNVNYRVQVNDKIALNTLTVNVAFYLIQKKYDNLCWRYKVFFRRRRKGYLKNFWKYKKLKFSKTAWARSFVFFYNFPTNYTVNYNTFSAIQTSREFNILNLRLNKYLNNFKKTDKLFRIVLSHYLNKK
jgi:ribosomal protein S4